MPRSESRPHRVTEAEIRATVDKVAGIARVLSDADPTTRRRVAVQIRGGSVIFDPLTGRLPWLCWFDKWPGRTPGLMIGARLWEGHFTSEWLFCWLW